MTGTELVSVVVPAHNAALYIRDALRSVLLQTWQSFEIIVVDDGSTDDTALVAREVGPSIHYLYQRNKGLAAARNTGIRHSHGEIIALLDADDLWTPEFLEVMAGLLARCPDAGGAYCGFQYVDQCGHVVGTHSVKVVAPQEFHEALVREGNWLSACGVIFRKHLAEGVGLFDESLRAAEDEDLWIRMSAHRPFVGVPRALVKYRRHDGNMSKDPERMVTAMLRVREKHCGPADGDVGTWPWSKVVAYRNVYGRAAIKYVAFGDMKKGAEFFQRLARLSWDEACGLSFWRGVVRAHIPEVNQFDDRVQIDWALVEARLSVLFDELAMRIPNGVVHRVKGSAYLAMADEARRGGDVLRAVVCLMRAALINPRIIVARAYWGTVARSARGLCRQPCVGKRRGDSTDTAEGAVG